VSYKLISVLKAADDGCFDIFVGKVDTKLDSSPLQVMKTSDEKPVHADGEVATSQRNLKKAQHK
jgi:hypothetical protein